MRVSDVRVYVHANVRAHVLTCVHAAFIAFVHAFVHACVHACVRACVRAEIRACTGPCVCVCVQLNTAFTLQCMGVQLTCTAPIVATHSLLGVTPPNNDVLAPAAAGGAVPKGVPNAGVAAAANVEEAVAAPNIPSVRSQSRHGRHARGRYEV